MMAITTSSSIRVNARRTEDDVMAHLAAMVNRRALAFEYARRRRAPSPKAGRSTKCSSLGVDIVTYPVSRADAIDYRKIVQISTCGRLGGFGRRFFFRTGASGSLIQPQASGRFFS